MGNALQVGGPDPCCRALITPSLLLQVSAPGHEPLHAVQLPHLQASSAPGCQPRAPRAG